MARSTFRTISVWKPKSCVGGASQSPNVSVEAYLYWMGLSESVVRRHRPLLHVGRPGADRLLPARPGPRAECLVFYCRARKWPDGFPPIPTMFANDSIPITSPATSPDTLNRTGRKPALHHRLQRQDTNPAPETIPHTQSHPPEGGSAQT